MASAMASVTGRRGMTTALLDWYLRDLVILCESPDRRASDDCEEREYEGHMPHLRHLLEESTPLSISSIGIGGT